MSKYYKVSYHNDGVQTFDNLEEAEARQRDIAGSVLTVVTEDLVVKGPIADDALMSVRVEVSEAGIYVTKFIVHGGTVNEFTFGTDEEEAKAKTNMLIDSMQQGLEFVQETVRNQYETAATEDTTE